MYAMTGKLTAQAGRRDQLVDILKRAADLVGGMHGCRMYIVTEDLANETTVWVFEMWGDKEAHDASLTDERVRSLIDEAMPLMDGAPGGAELRVAGGYGIGD
jgi:quinol monooxygenase YgiN